MNIVPTDKSYTYDLLTQNLFTLNRTFPFLNIQVVGSSVLGKNLYVVKLGTGSKKVFYSASFHAYHTQGQEIYWNFQNINPPNGYEIGEKFAKASGYLLTEVPYNSSFAGYKDWFILYFDKPGYTIEAGLGENPLPISQFNEIYNDNLGILILGAVS